MSMLLRHLNLYEGNHEKTRDKLWSIYFSVRWGVFVSCTREEYPHPHKNCDNILRIETLRYMYMSFKSIFLS